MDDLHAALSHHFGHRAFRPGQEQAIAAILAGRDVQVVMPTGAGKSLCYQLPALIGDELTIVVSPLVSLMADQVRGLQRAVGPDRIGLINAQQDGSANSETMRRAVRGDLRLLYVAPERFSSAPFMQQLSGVPIGLFAVDEAHCVSQWGHDFRPDYFLLADAARRLRARAILASTATATPAVAADIEARLGLRDPVRVSTGFDRPNLTFVVVQCDTAVDRSRQILDVLRQTSARPAIVYAGTRRNAELLAARLSEQLGLAVDAYHAGLGRERRAAVQGRFMTGATEVVVATNAFGMGIDKPDVRTVLHDCVPSSLEAYYQEAGRAGRDGAPARALLFATAKDRGLQVFFIRSSRADEVATAALWRQHRAIWSYVQASGCRRAAILRHFGDGTRATPQVPCCDICDAAVVPRSRRGSRGRPALIAGCDLDAAVTAVVARARPPVDRERLVEILRGRRSRALIRHSYDGLPQYGAFEHLPTAELLQRVDRLLADGLLLGGAGRAPTLRVPSAEQAIA